MFDEIVEEVEGAHTDEAQSQTLANVEQLTFEQAHALYMQAVEMKILDLHTSPDINLEDIRLRSSTAVRLQWLAQKTMAIVGVGGIGNWVWRMATALGVNKIIVIDNDQVEIQNVGPQFYNLTDLGRNKVDVVKDNMLMFSGTEISAICERVQSYDHLRTLCGGTPDILVTAVDNMDFRNRINGDIRRIMSNGYHAGYLPELYFDLRMSLGDWTAYMLPLVTISKNRRGLGLFDEYFFNAGAVFEQDDSVQEACTERAIVYTGANLASYVCAAIHWYANDGRVLLQESPENGWDNLKMFLAPDSEWEHAFSVQTTFSSRDWLSVTNTPTTRKMNKRLGRLSDDCEALERQKAELQERYEARIAELELQLANGSAAPVEDAAPSSRACVRPRQQPENTQLALHQVEQGYVLVFPEYRVYVDEVNNTFLRGVNLEDGRAERITGRAMSGLTTWYTSYDDYVEGPDYAPEEEIDPFDRPLILEAPEVLQTEEPIAARRPTRTDRPAPADLLSGNDPITLAATPMDHRHTYRRINLEELFGPTAVDAVLPEAARRTINTATREFAAGSPHQRQRATAPDALDRAIMDALEAQDGENLPAAAQFDPVATLESIRGRLIRRAETNAMGRGPELNTVATPVEDNDVPF